MNLAGEERQVCQEAEAALVSEAESLASGCLVEKAKEGGSSGKPCQGFDWFLAVDQASVL